MPAANTIVSSSYVSMRYDYNSNSSLQLASIVKSQSQIEAGIAAYLAQPVNSTITIADFGSSVGANSSTSVSHIIERLMAAGKLPSKSQISVIHSDLPRNNWSTLFEFVGSDPTSYAHRFDNVFTLASARGFYKQIMARNSLHFGYSNMALQFFSELPAKVKGHCFPNKTTDAEQLESFKTAAKKDVVTFLKARSLELVPGGILVLQYLMNSESNAIWNAFFETLNSSLKAVVELGKMTEEELDNINIPVYCRTRGEIVDSALLAELGLELVSAELAEPSENPLFQAYRQHGDADRFAGDFTLFVTSIFDSIFRELLNADRSEDDKNLASQELWNAYRRQVKLDPSNYSLNFPALYLVLRKSQ